MREILFRGKRVDNGEWVFGYFVNTDRNGSGYLIVDGWDCGYVHEVDEKSIGQYTGLKDKNGVKVFDGDILRDEDKKLGAVEFNKGRFVGDFDGRTYYYELYLDAEKSEVTGNIRDNHELLTEAKE